MEKIYSVLIARHLMKEVDIIIQNAELNNCVKCEIQYDYDGEHPMYYIECYFDTETDMFRFRDFLSNNMKRVD